MSFDWFQWALASASLRAIRRGKPAPFTCRKKWGVTTCPTRKRCLLQLTSLGMGKMCFSMNFVLACSVRFCVVLTLLLKQPVILSNIYMLCELPAYPPDLSQRQEAAALLHPCWQLQSGFYICCHLANYFSLLFQKKPQTTHLIQNQIITVWITIGLLSLYKTLCLWSTW